MALKKWIWIIIIAITALIVVSAFYYLVVGNSSLNLLEPNIAPQLRVNQEFTYLTSNRTIGETGYYFEKDVFFVNNTVVMDGITYYEVVRNWTGYASETCEPCPNGTKFTVTNRIEIFYYDTETGVCLGKSIDPLKLANEDYYATDVGFFASWMLGLKQGATWEMSGDAPWSYKFTVNGLEDVNGTMCFKVTMQYILRENIEEVRHYWIDENKRIMIEEEVLLPAWQSRFYKYLT